MSRRARDSSVEIPAIAAESRDRRSQSRGGHRMRKRSFDAETQRRGENLDVFSALISRVSASLRRNLSLSPPMKPRRILVVDDETGIRQSLSGVLEDEGYAVESVATGEECLERLPEGAFELVLLDIWLSGMDGLDVLSRIQERPFLERPAVVVISGHGNIETAVKATKLGALDFLEKPLSIEKVALAVKNALTHRSLTIENSRLKADTNARYRIIGGERPREKPCAASSSTLRWPRRTDAYSSTAKAVRRQGTRGARAALPEPARIRALRRK